VGNDSKIRARATGDKKPSIPMRSKAGRQVEVDSTPLAPTSGAAAPSKAGRGTKVARGPATPKASAPDKAPAAPKASSPRSLAARDVGKSTSTLGRNVVTSDTELEGERVFGLEMEGLDVPGWLDQSMGQSMGGLLSKTLEDCLDTGANAITSHTPVRRPSDCIQQCPLLLLLSA
jgi:hypothetical protein